MKNLLFLILLLPILFFSCEKDVVLDLADQEGAYVVVDADLTDGGYRQWIRLTSSTSYYNQLTNTGISGATVRVENTEDPSEVYQFFHAATDSLKGFYYHDRVTNNLQGKTMKLSIEYNNRTYTALSQWKPLPEIDSVSLRLNPFSQLGFFNDTIYDVMVHFRELPQPEDFYLFNLYVNDTLRTSRPSEKGLLSDENLNEYVSVSVISFNGKNVKEGDHLMVEMRSISKENYEFYNIFFFQTDLSGNPFAGAPPANIPTNLSAGARGFFQVSAVKKESIIFSPLR